jgi:hypothetical protein
VPVFQDPTEGFRNNCIAEGVFIRWAFDGSWEAIFFDGPFKGHKAKSAVADLTLENWEAVAKIHKYEMSYADSSCEHRKDATFHFLEMRCDRKLRDHTPPL